MKKNKIRLRYKQRKKEEEKYGKRKRKAVAYCLNCISKLFFAISEMCDIFFSVRKKRKKKRSRNIKHFSLRFCCCC